MIPLIPLPLSASVLLPQMLDVRVYFGPALLDIEVVSAGGFMWAASTPEALCTTGPFLRSFG